jgi:hypothetical protein
MREPIELPVRVAVLAAFQTARHSFVDQGPQGEGQAFVGDVTGDGVGE